LAPTVGIAATGFCHPGGILQLFLSTRSANFVATDSSSSQIASKEFVININYHLHHQDLHRFVVKNHQVHPNQQIAGRVSDVKEIQSDTS
jgi:hypothetical protein